MSGLPVAPREGKTCFHRLIILLESPPQSSGVLLPLGSPPFEPLIQAFAARYRSMQVNAWMGS